MPAATVGGRTAPTSKPARRERVARLGIVPAGVADDERDDVRVAPRQAARVRARRERRESPARSTRAAPAAPARRARCAAPSRAAAACAGSAAVENTNERARLTKYSHERRRTENERARGAERLAERADGDVDSRGRRARRRCRGRRGPTRPRRARRRRTSRRRTGARARRDRPSGARSPSIENMPSVTISARRASVRWTASSCSSALASACGYT